MNEKNNYKNILDFAFGGGVFSIGNCCGNLEQFRLSIKKSIMEQESVKITWQELLQLAKEQGINAYQLRWILKVFGLNTKK